MSPGFSNDPLGHNWPNQQRGTSGLGSAAVRSADGSGGAGVFVQPARSSGDQVQPERGGQRRRTQESAEASAATLATPERSSVEVDVLGSQ